MQARHLLLAAAAMAALAAPAAAKPESAKKAAKRVAKTMTKLKSYSVQAQIQVGMAQGKDHRMVQQRVNETYNCDVHSTVAHVKGSAEAFRSRMGPEGKGAIREGTQWKAILSNEPGRVLERLFKRPEDHFASVRKYAKLAKWLPPEKKAEPAGGAVSFGDEEEDEAVDAEAADDEDDTRVRGKQKSKNKNKGEEPLSHKFRIVAPTSEAINEFTTIVNSGCFGGG